MHLNAPSTPHILTQTLHTAQGKFQNLKYTLLTGGTSMEAQFEVPPLPPLLPRPFLLLLVQRTLRHSFYALAHQSALLSSTNLLYQTSSSPTPTLRRWLATPT